jgi:hypothetical protein
MVYEVAENVAARDVVVVDHLALDQDVGVPSGEVLVLLVLDSHLVQVVVLLGDGGGSSGLGGLLLGSGSLGGGAGALALSSTKSTTRTASGEPAMDSR